MSFELVDFLPPDFRRKRQLRRMRRRMVMMALTCGLALSAHTWSAARNRRELSTRLNGVLERYQAALGRVAEVEHLETRREDLTRKLAVLREVLERTRGADVLAVVSDTCPPSTRVGKLDLRVRDNETQPQIDVVLEGTCPDHADVAEFMRSLEHTALVTEVDMVRSEMVDAHRSDKRFVIKAQVCGLRPAEQP